MTFCPTGWFGRCLLRTGAPREPYPPVEPDLVVDEAPVALTQYGFAVHVQASPGHTPGPATPISAPLARSFTSGSATGL